MEYKDYYKILGVPRTASADDIKRAYRKLARDFHPDRNKSKQAEERFKEANEANEVLSDPTKRQAYDRLGADWRSGDGFSTPPGWNFGAQGRPGATRAGAAAAGAAQFGGFSDFFSTLFGSAAENPGAGGFSAGVGSAPRDQRAKITIALEDAYLGSTREISIGPRVLNVRIPKGVTSGQTIRLAGQGSGGGDLLLEVELAAHPTFRVEVRDIHVNVSIAPWEAALGARIPVPTLGGTVELNLPPNSQGGRKMRLKGRGLPGNPAGDEIITLGIVTPTAQSDEDRAFYEQMADRFEFDPRSV